MGTAFSCTECPAPTSGTVVNLSNELVLKIDEGVQPRKGKQVFKSLADHDWIIRIKCIDDSHSTAYGLSYEDVVKRIAAVERLIDKDMLQEHCPKDQLRSCLKLNKGCTLKCLKEVKDFIDCIDRVRYEKLEITTQKIRDKEEQAKKEIQQKTKKKAF